MELRNLLSFVAAADSGSIANAAKKCNLTSSAVSKHIKDLEFELDAQLLIRRKNDVKLTEYGELFVMRARNMIREAQCAKDEIAALRGELCGDLYIGAGCFIEPYIGIAIAEFMSRYPKVKIHMQYNYAHELNKHLRAKSLDVAFSMNDAHAEEGIESETCFKFQLCAIMGKNNVLANKDIIEMDDIANSRVILPDTGKRELATIHKQCGFDLSKVIDNVCCECNNANAILHGLCKLDAITFLPREYVEYRTNLVAKKIVGFEHVLTSKAHWLKNAPMKASVRELLNIIHQQERELFVGRF